MLVHPATDLPKSSIRRKPIFTYKSPTANDLDPSITLSTRFNPAINSQSPSTESNITKVSRDVGRYISTNRRVEGHSLPLYHPMGDLALSLPPLDPADFNLPLPTLPDNSTRRLSARSRRLPAKIRDIDEEGELSVSLIAAVAASEVKRASPRKRRLGAVNGKRRRRDIDDGDATYPAKRTRQARAGAVEDNDIDDVRQIDADGTSDIDALAEQRSERRSTRSRPKRRDSSEPESLADEQPTQVLVMAVKEGTNRSTLEARAPSQGIEEGELVQSDNAT